MIAVVAGASYFAVVFALAFALGAFRTVILQPLLGDALPVLLELPVVLIFSWWASGWISRVFKVPPALGPRLVMGAAAFALLMAAEAGIAAFIFNRTLGEHIASYRLAPKLLGLAGQIAFALFPSLRR